MIPANNKAVEWNFHNCVDAARLRRVRPFLS
jgi:hypothetical protein